MRDTALPPFSAQAEGTLIRRINAIKLYKHAYSLYLNFHYHGFTPCDLLDFTAKHLYSHIDKLLKQLHDHTTHSLEATS